jgi:hypothetical protein
MLNRDLLCAILESRITRLMLDAPARAISQKPSAYGYSLVKDGLACDKYTGGEITVGWQQGL